MSTTTPKTKKASTVKRNPVSKEKRPALVGIGRDPITGKNIPHEFDARVAKSVAFYASTGLTENDIAEMLNMRPGKLKSLYGHELKTGLNQANVQVAQAMHTSALEGDTVAGKFWLKSRAGWKDGESALQLQSPLQIHIHD